MRLPRPLPPPAGSGAEAGPECECKPPEVRGSERPTTAREAEQKNSTPTPRHAAGNAPSCTRAIAEAELPAKPEAQPRESPAGWPATATTEAPKTRDAPAQEGDEF